MKKDYIFPQVEINNFQLNSNVAEYLSVTEDNGTKDSPENQD